MTSSAYQRAAATARNPNASSTAVFAAATALDDAFARGEATAGLLPADAATLLLHLYDRAGELGVTAAWPAIGAVYSSSAYRPTVHPNQSRALSFYRRGAATGDRAATVAFIRATHFAHPDLGEPFYAEAAAKLNALLSQSSDAELLVLAAWMLNDGQGYAPDPERARAMLEVAAAAGNPEALFELYVYESRGIGGPLDAAHAQEHLFAAANAGHVRAMANLGGMYATGNGVPTDPTESVRWYRHAADAGHPRAAFNLSVMYGTGEGAPRDPELSDHYRRRADALGYRAK